MTLETRGTNTPVITFDVCFLKTSGTVSGVVADEGSNVSCSGRCGHWILEGQAPGLSFRCICHLGYRIVSALCGGIWIQSWEEASYVQSLWGKLSRDRTSHWQISSPSKVARRRETTVGMSLLPRLDEAEAPHPPCLDGQVWFPGVTHRAIKRYQKSEDAVMEDCTESHQAVRINRKIRANDKLHRILTNMPDEHKSLIYGDSLKARMQSLEDGESGLAGSQEAILTFAKSDGETKELPGTYFLRDRDETTTSFGNSTKMDRG